jgi:hypothetical protein
MDLRRGLGAEKSDRTNPIPQRASGGGWIVQKKERTCIAGTEPSRLGTESLSFRDVCIIEQAEVSVNRLAVSSELSFLNVRAVGGREPL